MARSSKTKTKQPRHSDRFIHIVNEAKKHIKETDIHTVKNRLDDGENLLLIDVREESEFADGHIANAIHLSKGIIERDIEAKCPETETELILYCGGGYRSALAAYNLTLMGYRKVLSMDGGIRSWREAGFETESGD